MAETTDRSSAAPGDRAGQDSEETGPGEEAGSGPLARISLKYALIILLAAALLPAGGFSIGQAINNLQSSEELREEADLARLSHYTDAVGGLLERAQSLLSYAVGNFRNVASSPSVCNAEMRRITSQNRRFLAAFLIDRNGVAICGATDDFTPTDVSGRETFRRMSADPRPHTTVAVGAITKQPVLIVSHPIPTTERFDGFASISISLETIDGLAKLTDDDLDGRFAVFEAGGDNAAPLASDNGPVVKDGMGWLPWANDLRELSRDAPVVRALESRDGTDMVYAARTIAGQGLFAVAAWPAARVYGDSRWRTAFAVALPILTWLLATAIVYFAVDRLVIANMRRLTDLSEALRKGDLTARAEFGEATPLEFAELGSRFNDMAERIEQRDSALRRAVVEERMLLREVYHRVKNNLQLIVSLLNLQSRKVETEEGRAVIRHTQDRVQSLAFVHQNLYQAGQLSEARLDRVIEQIVSATGHLRDSDGGVATSLDLDPVTLDADRAVPAALLSTEALMNASKHGFPPGVDGKLEIRLRAEPDGGFHLRIANSVAADTAPDGLPPDTSRSIGARLMLGFARQLRATLVRQRRDDMFVVELDAPPPIDDVRKEDPAEVAPPRRIISSGETL